MLIKCWGSRGSIPVSGSDYLKYGGDTTCLEIRTKSDDIIIIDSGTGIRRLGNQLLNEGHFRYHFLFTHAHWDHVMGFPFFKPIFYKRAEFLMHRCPFGNKFVETVLGKVMKPPYFPVRYEELQANMTYQEACPSQFEIGSVSITPIPLSHPNQGSGYKFVEDGKTFVFLTDNELSFTHKGGMKVTDYTAFSAGADLLIHDAEYTPEEYENTVQWGHSMYTEVLDLAFEAEVKRLGLFHLNQERSDRDMDEIVDICTQRITVKGKDIECFAVGCDSLYHL
jgi:phosphoribosyl 1,2-cyclic phosphodiesterase